MFKVTGNGSITTCDGVTRRDFLQIGALGAIGLTLAKLAELQALGATATGSDEKSCIMIFNLGAPSQIDTWDMKPNAPSEIRGPFKPIRTNNPDIQISEIFPLHAKLADKFSLVRTCYHTAAAVHDTGHQMMQTGRVFTGRVNTPHAGCALEYLKGRRNELPAHVVLPEPMGPTGGNLPHGQDAGFLGKSFDPFVLNADPSKKDFKVPDLLPPSEIGQVRLQRRRELRDVVEGTVKNFEASPNAQLMDASFASAYRLMTSEPARQAFDLAKEPEKVRERYGLTSKLTALLFIALGQEDDVAVQTNSGALERHHDRQVGDDHAFVINCAPAVEVPFLDDRPKGIDAPLLLLHADRVDVAQQQQRPRGVGHGARPQPRNDHAAFRRALQYLGLNPFLLQHARQITGCGKLVTGGIDGLDAQQISQPPCGFALHLRQIGLRGLLAKRAGSDCSEGERNLQYQTSEAESHPITSQRLMKLIARQTLHTIMAILRAFPGA